MSNALSEKHEAPSSLPDWFRAQQKSAADSYGSIPMPSRKDESWRFANLAALDLQDYAPARPLAPEATAQLLERSSGFSENSGTLVFANDQTLSLQGGASLPKGVLFMPLSEALQKHSDLVRAHFMREEPLLGSRKFEALHRSSIRNGTFLYVPEGVRIDLPLQSFHWLSGEKQSVFPHTLAIVEKGASATIMDWFQSCDTAPGLACGINDLIVGENAELRYVSLQDWSRQTLSFQSNSTRVAAGGKATHLTLHVGGKVSRTESVSRLNGPGSRSDMLAATVADRNQEFDQRTLQDHRAPHTESDLLYKNALYDASKTIFAGLIRVEPHAHYTDAYQKVRNLVLSDEAEANSMPGLEILADQVKCSHGATTGEINPEELFYMQARGIRERDAFRLITFGFLNEVLERFPCESVRPVLQKVLLERISGH